MEKAKRKQVVRKPRINACEKHKMSYYDKSNIIREVKGSNSKSLSTLISGDLVRQILKSLTNTLLLLNKNQDSNHVPGRDISDGAYKKLKTLNTNHPKGSNKRKSISATWEKTSSILIDDGYTWRKYGQKKITKAKYYRSYYRCTHMNDQHCEVIKHVQRTQEYPPLYKTTYYGHHTCKGYFHSDINCEPILSPDDSSVLLRFDNNVLIKHEYQLPLLSQLPSPSLLASIKEDPLKEIHDDYFDQNQLFLSENFLSLNRLKKTAVSSFILDCKLVAYDRAKQRILPFQHLYGSFVEETGFFQFATTTTSNDVEEIQNFLKEAIDASIGDSLDLVPIGTFAGRGKRTGVYGAFLLACYDTDREEFQSLCKIGIGFTENVLEERSTSLGSKVIPKPKSYYQYGESVKPDVWFEASEVWEIKAADMTISPIYQAAVGTVDPNKGISLRFLRLLRVRPDIAPEQATSSEQIDEMYKAQKHNHNDIQDARQNDDEDV